MSDHASNNPDPEDEDGFAGFGIPIPKGLVQAMMASRAAHEEASSKLRVRYDSILQHFRIDMHLLTEGLDGIDEQSYRLAFESFRKAEKKLMALNNIPPRIRKVITASLREILDFVDFIPPCPHCHGDQSEGEHQHSPADVSKGATVATEEEFVADNAAEVDAARDASYDEEAMLERVRASGINYRFEHGTMHLDQPTDLDDIRSFPSFLTALKLDFPHIRFETQQ